MFHNEDPLLKKPDIENRHVINVPHQCPIGFRPDALGNCRQIWRWVNDILQCSDLITDEYE